MRESVSAAWVKKLVPLNKPLLILKSSMSFQN